MPTDVPPPKAETNLSGLIEQAKAIWSELAGLMLDRLHLAALETKHVGENLIAMVATGVIVAVLLVSAWLGLVGALVLWLIDLGVSGSIAMLLGAVINIGLAVILYLSLHRQRRKLGWPATLRSLQRLDDSKEMHHGNS